MSDSKVGKAISVPFQTPQGKLLQAPKDVKARARQDSPSPVKAQQTGAPYGTQDGYDRQDKHARNSVSLDAATKSPRALSSLPPDTRPLEQNSLVTRIAMCIGIWETNRNGDQPVIKESGLNTVAGMPASMATLEQATMPYAITALKSHKDLRDKAEPPLTMRELQDADARCRAVNNLLLSVDEASSQGQTPSEFIKNNAAAIRATGLSNDDVETMFSAAALKDTIDTAHSNIETAGKLAKEGAAKEKKSLKQQKHSLETAKKEALKKAMDAIPESERLGLGNGSLSAYIKKPEQWGENRAAWQRKAINAMPGDVGKRIEEVSVSENGTALALPVIKSRVEAQLARRPVPSEEAIIKTVAQQNNHHEVGYGKHVWQTYQRLYSDAKQ